MWRTLRIGGALAFVVLATAGARAGAAELLTNGGFEDGTFNGWTTTQPGTPLAPWQVTDTSGGGFFTNASPQEGTYDALNGFDGDGPAHYTLTQQVSIPAGVTAVLTWKDRVQYAMVGGAAPRTVEVKVLDAETDAVLGTPYSLSTGPGDDTCCGIPPGHDLGWQSHMANLTAFAGKTVKVVFDETVPEAFTGPGQVEFDAISLATAPAKAMCNGQPATIIGSKNADTINGTDGNDVIVSLGGDDVINSGTGDDTICSGPGNDTINTGAATHGDFANGGDGNDVINAGAGNDTLQGGLGDDQVFGGAGNDGVYGGAGNDELSGGQGDDFVSGGTGDDKLTGGDADDHLNGFDGNDRLFGNAGNDQLQGGTGNDRMDGGADTDSCDGGTGTDVATATCEADPNVP